jgi:hypothetical protein
MKRRALSRVRSRVAPHRDPVFTGATCKHLLINRFVYLRDVIERVSTHPARCGLELTPRE